MSDDLKNITIRQAESTDFDAVFALLKEFAFFQKTPEKLFTTAEQMKRDKHLFHCLVAETTEQTIIGFITFFPAYYSWSGKAMYINDLYVTNDYRKSGTGKKLLASVVHFAKENECKKVRWQVSCWNTNAIDFYKNIGAIIDDTEQNCDLLL